MGATSVRQDHHRVGLAVYGVVFVIALALFGIGLPILARAWEAPTGLLVATVAYLVGTIAFCAWTGAAVIYQAKSEPLLVDGKSVLWAPPLVMRVLMVVMAASIGIIGVAIATLEPRLEVLFILYVVLFTMVFITFRFLVMRFEANHLGITCAGPLTTARIPWSAVRSLEVRGSSWLIQLPVVITEDGRKHLLWITDPRFPVGRGAARRFVAQLDAIRPG